jgi:hypothetical protein
MSEILDNIVADYDQKIQQEKQRVQELEQAVAIGIRNIDRLEGAKLGVQDAQAKILADSDPSPECEIPQEGTEEQG